MNNERTQSDLSTLQSLSTMILELRKVSSPMDKVSILKKYSELSWLLQLLYDSSINFYITGARLEDVYDRYVNSIDDLEKVLSLEELLAQLSCREITGDRAIKETVKFLDKYYQFEEAIVAIFDRDLSCGVGVSILNTAFPGLTEPFSVPLAKDFSKHEKNLFKRKDSHYFVSRKLDGIRCLAFIENGSVSLFSRKGRPINTLQVIEQDLLSNWNGPKNIILDGELCLMNDGVEDFKGITSAFRRKDYTIPNPKLLIFDMYPISEFHNGTKTTLGYYDRKREIWGHRQSLSSVSLLHQMEVLNRRELDNFIEAIPEEWEGLVLRTPGPTEFKRTSNLLKIKLFKDAEYVVQDIERSVMQMNGQERQTCGALVIYHEGNPVKIGSGISWEQRIAWAMDPSLIIGKTITVKYFSESTDGKGKKSLRKATLKNIVS